MPDEKYIEKTLDDGSFETAVEQTNGRGRELIGVIKERYYSGKPIILPHDTLQSLLGSLRVAVTDGKVPKRFKKPENNFYRALAPAVLFLYDGEFAKALAEFPEKSNRFGAWFVGRKEVDYSLREGEYVDEYIDMEYVEDDGSSEVCVMCLDPDAPWRYSQIIRSTNWLYPTTCYVLGDFITRAQNAKLVLSCNGKQVDFSPTKKCIFGDSFLEWVFPLAKNFFGDELLDALMPCLETKIDGRSVYLSDISFGSDCSKKWKQAYSGDFERRFRTDKPLFLFCASTLIALSSGNTSRNPLDLCEIFTLDFHELLGRLAGCQLGGLPAIGTPEYMGKAFLMWESFVGELFRGLCEMPTAEKTREMLLTAEVFLGVTSEQHNIFDPFAGDRGFLRVIGAEDFWKKDGIKGFNARLARCRTNTGKIFSKPEKSIELLAVAIPFLDKFMYELKDFCAEKRPWEKRSFRRVCALREFWRLKCHENDAASAARIEAQEDDEKKAYERDEDTMPRRREEEARRREEARRAALEGSGTISVTLQPLPPAVAPAPPPEPVPQVEAVAVVAALPPVPVPQREAVPILQLAGVDSEMELEELEQRVVSDESVVDSTDAGCVLI